MIQFNPLTLLLPNLTAQTAVMHGELTYTPSDSSFTPLASPSDLLNGTLSGLTVTAAALGSPALARVCSHPVFASAALYLGVSHQIQAWAQVNGLIPGALLFLSSVATAVGGYSFYRGFKAGWQALKDSSRLAVYDQVRTLQEKAEAHLNRAFERTKHYPILSEAKKLAEETHADVKAAVEHFKDLRDEKPQRIEAARLSGLAGIGQTDPNASETIRQRVVEARAAAQEAARKASLTSRLVPATLSRIRDPLDSATAAEVKAALETTSEIERLLETTVKESDVMRRWKALTSADSRAFIRKTTIHAEEAQRVASASPRNWVTEAIGDPTYSPTEKKAGHWLGNAVNGSLLYAVPALATMQLLAGSYTANQLVTWGLSLAPAAATYLYNKRQGSRRFNVSPAASQELPMERYSEDELQQRTSERLDPAVPPMEVGEEERFVAETQQTLAKVEADIKLLEALEVPTARKADATLKTDVTLSDEPWMRDKSRRYTPIENLDPNRAYGYDHRPGQGDTEEKKRIRTFIKAITLDRLEDAIRRGDVTHVDILNMICDHPAALDGAVTPRPLTGKLRRELMKLAREADRNGIIRHFAAVKDLFPGVDGVVTAGSKTTYLTDLGPSPLVQRIIEQGFIPIPCGLTAGANGGSGLYNGHGAVGNPRVPGHDTGGSSSAAAYILSLEDLPIRLAIGTDTGGSISAPCGAAKLFGWVPEKGMFSRINMIPFATHLDTPGVMGVDRNEVLWMARVLTVPAYQSQYQAPAEAPEVYYFETDTVLVSKSSQANFSQHLDGLRTKGFQVTPLDARFAAFRRIPLDLYPDSYVAAAFTLMNPLEKNRFGEPQRYILDRNLQNRLAKANVLLKTKDERYGNLFNRYLDLHVRFRNLVHRKFPTASVFVAPTPEAVPLDDFKPNGLAGIKLDSHDMLGGMLKNRTDRALFVDSKNRLVIEGRTGEILAVSEGHNMAVMTARIAAELSERFPNLAQEKYRPLIGLMAKDAIKAWICEGSLLPANNIGQGQIPEVYLDRSLVHLVKMLQKSNKQEILDELRANDRGNRTQRTAKQNAQETRAA